MHMRGLNPSAPKFQQSAAVAGASAFSSFSLLFLFALLFPPSIFPPLSHAAQLRSFLMQLAQQWRQNESLEITARRKREVRIREEESERDVTAKLLISRRLSTPIKRAE